MCIEPAAGENVLVWPLGTTSSFSISFYLYITLANKEQGQLIFFKSVCLGDKMLSENYLLKLFLLKGPQSTYFYVLLKPFGRFSFSTAQ